MEIRRVLLLFAIVLGLAAIASSIANPPDDGEETATRPQPDADDREARPRPGARGADPVTVRLSARRPGQTREVEQGQPATVLVEVDAPAQIEIPSLGLNQSAEPLTPARFDVLEREPGEHRVFARPAEARAEPSPVGTLAVVPAR